MTARTLTVPGPDGPLQLAVAEAGGGGRPLLAVHGFAGAKEDFTDWLEPLAGLGWHAVAIDQRGHGESSKSDDEAAYSFDAFADDLLAALDALGWERAVVLGHSMGGMVVQTALLRAPERFHGVVLMDTSHRALRADPALIELAVSVARSEGMAAVLAGQEALAGDSPLTNEIGERLKTSRPGYKEFCDRKLLAACPAMYAAMIQTITDRGAADRLPELRSVQVPVLVVVGEADSAFRKPSARMAEAIPGAELAVIPDAGHSPQFENPDPWWQALSKFLARL